MISVRDNIVSSFAFALKGEMPLAMRDICFAVEDTARKAKNVDRVTRSTFKNFVREMYWIIEPFLGPNDLEKTKFPSFVSDDGKKIVEPDLADVIYHIFRCAFAHGGVPKADVSFTKSTAGAAAYLVHTDGSVLHIPDRLVWGLLGACVLSSANKDIVSETGYFFIVGSTEIGGIEIRFPLDQSWGDEEIFRPIFDAIPRSRIAINMNPDRT